MRFTLRYAGDDLKSAANSARVTEKHGLRMHFHEQLKHIWANHKSFAHIDRAALQAPVFRNDRWHAPAPNPTSLQSLTFRRQVGGASFIPLLTPQMEVHCNLALRLGRPTLFGTIFAGGDLDGRLKTLFDAMAVPKVDAHVPADAQGNDYFCLLSDDDLITGISISSYQILIPCSIHHVEIDLEVTIVPVTPMAGPSSLIFGGW